VVAALLAFLGYSLLNLGQGAQKAGLDVASSRRVLGWTIWTIGTISTSVSVLVVLGALSVGQVSVVGAMAGSGLVSLTIFSAVVLKERLGRLDFVGIGTIVAGSVVLGLRSVTTTPDSVPFLRLWILLGVVGALGGSAFITGDKRIRGFLLAAWAGVVGGSSTVVQKAAAIETGASSTGAAQNVMQAIGSPLTLLWIFLSISSFVIIQFAYKRAAAIHTVPAFSVAFMAAPVVGGVVVYGESLGLFQWVGLIVVVAGVVMLSRSSAEES
jgi:drug/metabolite transporter (DMT)-like permease